MTLHQPVQVPGSVAPRGYSDGVVSSAGCRLLHLGGHVAFDSERRIRHPGDLVGQMRVVLENLKGTLSAAGGGPEHLVKLTIHTTDVLKYRANLGEIGKIWRSILGCAYPAMTLLGVRELFDDGAVLEIDGVAALPPDSASDSSL